MKEMELWCIPGLVPEQKIQRATNETAECSGGPSARLLQGPEEDEAPGRQTGGCWYFGTWGLWLLWRWDMHQNKLPYHTHRLIGARVLVCVVGIWKHYDRFLSMCACIFFIILYYQYLHLFYCFEEDDAKLLICFIYSPSFLCIWLLHFLHVGVRLTVTKQRPLQA